MENINYINLFGIIAAIITGFSHILYIKSIIKGITKPSRITWFIWSILGTIIAASYYISGATSTLWVPIGEAFWYITIAILSIKYGHGGWTKIDRIALIGASASGIMWYVTGSATIALISAILVDLMAAIPTIYKSYINSTTEDGTAWILTSTGSIFNLIAINTFTFSIMIYPIYMLTINTLITILLFRNKIIK